MKDANTEILKQLSERGYRITEARKEVIGALARMKQPQSLPSLCAQVHVSDEASVYRTIRMLVEEGFAEEVVIQNQPPRYALSHGHHHHAVCTNCGFMEHIDCNLSRVHTPSTFRSVDAHEMTLYGLCKKCA